MLSYNIFSVVVTVWLDDITILLFFILFQRQDESGTCVRGEIHMLLVGDPGNTAWLASFELISIHMWCFYMSNKQNVTNWLNWNQSILKYKRGERKIDHPVSASEIYIIFLALWTLGTCALIKSEKVLWIRV